MCDPVTLGLGMAASAGGGLLSRNSALKTAQDQAAARNAVLGNTIHGLNSIYNKTNAPAFGGAVGAVDINKLGGAQDARVANNVGNVVAPDINAPSGGDVPPAVANAYKKSLGDAFKFATNQATSAGKLGGYGDQWFNSNLAKQEGARKIGIGNANAENLKALLPGEQDLAEQQAWRPPSMWGQVLSGGGKLLGSAAGGGAGMGSLGSAFIPAGALSGGLV